MAVITADSTPIYNTAFFGTSSDAWSCNDWVVWHNELVKKYGKDQANSIWIKAWLDGVSVASGGTGNAPGSGFIMDSVPLDCRTYNTDFKNFLEKNPALKDTVFSGILGSTVGRATSSTVGVVTSSTNIVDSAANAAANTANMLKWLLPLVVILVLIAVSYYVYKNFLAE